MQPRPGNEYMIPDPNPRGKKVVKMPVVKKKPVKGSGAGEKAYPMPGINKKPVKGSGGAYPMPGITRSTGGGIVGTTGKNVNSVYNTY